MASVAPLPALGSPESPEGDDSEIEPAESPRDSNTPTAIRRRNIKKAEERYDATVPKDLRGGRQTVYSRIADLSPGTAFVLAGTLLALASMTAYLWRAPEGSQVMTAEQLQSFDGTADRKIYLAILGRIFDVSRKPHHYGPGGGYAAFAGRDASLAFITGKFQEDLTDDVSSLTTDQLQSLLQWQDFYHKEYRWVGKLLGRFYNADGTPTEELRQLEAKARSLPQRQQTASTQSAACVKNAGTVSCVDRSRHPRQVFHGGGRASCECFGSTVFSSQRRLYPGCAPNANSCSV